MTVPWLSRKSRWMCRFPVDCLPESRWPKTRRFRIWKQLRKWLWEGSSWGCQKQMAPQMNQCLLQFHLKKKTFFFKWFKVLGCFRGLAFILKLWAGTSKLDSWVISFPDFPGTFLDPTSCLATAGLQDGDQLTAVVQLPQMAATEAGNPDKCSMFVKVLMFCWSKYKSKIHKFSRTGLFMQMVYILSIAMIARTSGRHSQSTDDRGCRSPAWLRNIFYSHQAARERLPTMGVWNTAIVKQRKA